MPAHTRKQNKSPNSNAQPPTQSQSNQSLSERTIQSPPRPQKRTRTANGGEINNINQVLNSTIDSTPTLDEDTAPTLKNYESLLKYWPPGRIHKYLQSNKGSTVNRAPPAVQDHVKLIHNRFKQELLMMAMIGGVSESTITSYM